MDSMDPTATDPTRDGNSKKSEKRPEQRPVKFFNPRAPWGEFSNFYPSPILVDGRIYPTVEHYYQACKTVTEEKHEMIRCARTAAKTKRMGTRIEVRPDWEEVKLDVMRIGLQAKFHQHPLLARRLLSTGNRPLHEASPNDRFWGWMDGKGDDFLGRLLTKMREELREESKKGK